MKQTRDGHDAHHGQVTKNTVLSWKKRAAQQGQMMGNQDRHKMGGSPPPAVESGRLYTAGGLWLAHNAVTGAVRIGLSDAAQRAAGPILYVELPERGMSLEADDELANIETAEAGVSLPVPAGGTVLALNTALAQAPDLINRSPYDEGWLVELRPACWPVEGLLDEKAYAALAGD